VPEHEPFRPPSPASVLVRNMPVKNDGPDEPGRLEIEDGMPSVNVKVIEGVFSPKLKHEIIETSPRPWFRSRVKHARHHLGSSLRRC
jgi:hypothetical protein